jgi:hypothetical protein
MYRFAHEVVEYAETVVPPFVIHGSPHSQGASLDHCPIVPELNRVQTGLRESAVPDSEGNANHLQRVGAELDWAFAGLEDILSGILEHAGDVPFPLPSTLGQGKEDAELAVEQRVWRIIQRVNIAD